MAGSWKLKLTLVWLESFQFGAPVRSQVRYWLGCWECKWELDGDTFFFPLSFSVPIHLSRTEPNRQIKQSRVFSILVRMWNGFIVIFGDCHLFQMETKTRSLIKSWIALFCYRISVSFFIFLSTWYIFTFCPFLHSICVEWKEKVKMRRNDEVSKEKRKVFEMAQAHPTHTKLNWWWTKGNQTSYKRRKRERKETRNEEEEEREREALMLQSEMKASFETFL